MLYTTSLMKRIQEDLDGSLACDLPPAPDVILPHVSSSTYDIPGISKHMHLHCGDVCSRHTLYKRDPYCHHRRRAPYCNDPTRHTGSGGSNIFSNKMFSLSMDSSSDKGEHMFLSPKPEFYSRSMAWKSYGNRLHEPIQPASSLCGSCPTIGGDISTRILVNPLANTTSEHLTEIGDHSKDPAKTDDIQWLHPDKLYSNPHNPTARVHDRTSGTFHDRLLYFPLVSNQMKLDYKINEPTDTDYPTSDQLGRKKTLKFVVPDFLVPILDRSMPCDSNSNRRQTIVVNANEARTSKKRRTFREKLRRMHSNFDGRMWNYLNGSFKFIDKEGGQAMPSTRSRSLLTTSVELGNLQTSNSPESESSCDECRRIVLNVSGLKFETWLTVLSRHPETLLGNPVKRKAFFDQNRNEYFFDRHRPSFEAIFNYYQYGGRLKRPATVCDDIFLRELEFFEIEPEALESYKRDEGYVPDVIILPEKPWKRKLWMLFEYPETSLLAFGFSIASFIFTVTSIILFCVETLPTYAQTHCEPGAKPNFKDPFFIIETLCTIWFTLEIFIRFISCPSPKNFVKDVKNLIDLAAIVPYYITLCNVLITFSCEGAKSSASLAFLRVIRLIRVFKLTKHSSGLQVLVLTFKESIEGLSLFLVAFIVCILVFSSTIYYVEIDRKGSQIESIPDAFWWAVITMCTVGYGDKVPKGPLGKVVGSICAVAGVLTLAIPVPIITENFNKFYAHKTGRGRR